MKIHQVREKNRIRPLLEALEERWCPATYKFMALPS
jgi:hypothetical protein